MKIEAKEITIIDGTWSQENAPKKVWAIEDIKRPGIPVDWDKFLRSIEESGEGLKDGEKVYFTAFSNFPRYKFRETFPKNPIVRNSEKADVLILDCSTLYKILRNGTYSYVFNKCKDFSDTWVLGQLNTYWKLEVESTSKYFYRSMFGQKSLDISLLSNIGNKRIIYDDTLLKSINQDCVELTLDMMDNIAGLLNSNDKDDVKIAINICTTLNFEKYGHIIAYLILQCGKRFNTWYGTSTGSLGKLFIDKLEKQYSLQNKNVHEFLKNVVMYQGTEDHEFVEKCLQVYIDQHVGANLFKVTRM